MEKTKFGLSQIKDFCEQEREHRKMKKMNLHIVKS